MQDIEALYKLMPKSGRAGFLTLIDQWYRERSDPKVASDLIQLALKSAPLLGVIVFPLLLAVLVWFRDSISENYKENATLFWIIATVASTSVIIYFSNLFLDEKLNRELLELDVHKDFKIIQHVVCVKIISPTEAIYAFRFIVRPKKTSQAQFPILYNWSGEGVVDINTRNKRYKISKLGKIAGNFSKAIIIFDKLLNKKEEIEIEYHIHTISKDDEIPVPHIGLSSHCKKYPRFNTHMIVIFQQNSLPISVCREYYYGSYALGALKTLTVSLDESAIHRWGVRALMNWCYCIRWDFGA